MEKYEIQKLRDLPIEEVAERIGLQVVRHKSLCPFHDDHHASLSFSVGRNMCRCFVCMEKSLGTIDLVMRSLHVDFVAACRWLAERFDIPLSGGNRTMKHSFDSSQGYGSQAGGSVGCPSQKVGKQIPSQGKDFPKPHPFDANRYARFFEHPWLSDEARRFLFDERHIDERVVRWCRLTSWCDREGTHWLQIPYFDISGRLIGIQNRNLDYTASDSLADSADDADFGNPADFKNSADFINSAEETNGKDSLKESNSTNGEGLIAKPRFRFPYGAKCGIYNLPVVGRMKPGDELYITEGCSDCWAMLSAGHKAIAIPSATLLTPEDKELLAALSSRLAIKWHMFPDRDAPGERLFLQLKELLPSIQHHQLPLGCKDFGEWFRRELSALPCPPA